MTRSPSLKRAGTLLFLGIVQFAFFLQLSEVYYPGYDVSSDVISDLGATCRSGACTFVHPSSEIFNASVSLLGLLLLGASYLLWKGYGSNALAPFVALSGVGTIGVGVFNESFGWIHVFFSAITFLSTGIQAILVFRVVKAPMSYFSMAAGVATLGAAALYGTKTYLGLGQGGMERMVVYPVLLAGIGFAGYLLSSGDTDIR